MFIYIYIYTICYLYYIYILSSMDALTKEIFDLENHRFAETSWGENSFILNLVDGRIYPQYIWENIFFGKVICFGKFISFLFRHIVHCIRNEQFHNFLGRPQVGMLLLAILKCASTLKPVFSRQKAEVGWTFGKEWGALGKTDAQWCTIAQLHPVLLGIALQWK